MENLIDALKIKPATFFVSVFSIFVIVSCSNLKDDTRQTPNTTFPLLGQEENISTVNETPISELNNTSQESSGEDMELVTEVILNPPHGEPGHRCDIAVGSPLPLDSPTSVSTTQATTNAATSTSVNVVNEPVVSNAASERRSNSLFSIVPTVNPPHGQLGHRCDIAVGAPLPAVNTSIVRINPPHGEPGHRCDIPVGDPLPSS